jgi:hypothetical protein
MLSPGPGKQLSGGPRKLLINVQGSYFDIDEGGLNIGVPHQAHEGGKADAGAHHVGGEGVPKGLLVLLMIRSRYGSVIAFGSEQESVRPPSSIGFSGFGSDGLSWAPWPWK